MPIANPAKPKSSAKWKHFEVAKVAIALSIVFVLLYAGLRGRQHARLQVSLQDIMLVRDQLQQVVDDEQAAIDPLAGIGGANGTANRPPTTIPKVAALVNDLSTRLRQFDLDYPPSKLSEVENLEIRLTKATLANTDQRFTDALAMIPGEDETRTRANIDDQNRRLVRILKLRGDSLYGMQKWQEALDRYQQILALNPNRAATMARAADCQYALGKTNEALVAYQELVKIHSQRGDDFLIQGKTDAALAHYNQAIQIQSRLLERQGRSELAVELAKAHNKRGNAFLSQGKVDAAIPDFQKSIEILTRLIEKENKRELANDLATSHSNLGNAFFGQQKLDAVISHYGKAIELQTALAERRPPAWESDLAVTHNNRGVVHRAQGKLGAAIADFELAIQSLTALVEQPGGSESAMTQTNRSVVSHPQVKLDVILGYSEKEVDVQTLPRLADEMGRREQSLTLATVLKNRAYARLAQGQRDGAMSDFQRALEVYGKLAEAEAQSDSTLQASLTELRSTLERYQTRIP